MATCTRCHRPLSDPESVERGFGPVCWAAVQADQREYKKPFQDPALLSDFNYHADLGSLER
jgi:hypothetical protein